MRVAAIQLNSTDDKARNLERRRPAWWRTAAAGGAELVVAAGEVEPARRRGRRSTAGAETLDGGPRSPPPATGRASSASTWSPAASPSAAEGEERLFNTSCLIDPDGELVAAYRKIHMFDVDVGGVSYRESDARAARRRDRRRRASAGSSSGSASATTCASPSSTGSSPSRGARVITVPAAFTIDDRPRPLGGPAAGPGDREPGVRDRRRTRSARRPRTTTPTGAR